MRISFSAYLELRLFREFCNGANIWVFAAMKELEIRMAIATKIHWEYALQKLKLITYISTNN
ncbi:hypothetical protein ACN23B_02225 [Anabaena sp. FACHB-709]|uniref:Transposase n=1 Tax=Anabaena cylindrica FACHB-318 TaxID=2692880 RepID=A0ABR7ZI02_ANACY|nr:MULTISPECIES: hypothetical protein [Nostocaceae]MBD2172098.1 hypothetical protein [Anabaena cylindrica FACHB-318]MBD2284808.1 hypothetical protein [Anabaena cylindrica FACHB-170]MBD2350545.1 hypothetical protein [Trichormus variabilis FACHB-171]BAB72406.1 asl0448 [Nostoc sp. PCC 7120 = FACHB-418]